MKEDNLSEYGAYEPIIEKLPYKDRTLLEMYYIQQQTQKRISEFYNVTQSAISKRLKYIRIKIVKENNNLLLDNEIKNRRPISYDDVIDLHNKIKDTNILLDLL